MEAFSEKTQKIGLFLELTAQIKDHRRIDWGNIKYSLEEILFLTTGVR